MFREHIQTAFKHIRRSPYQAFAAILVMSLMFFAASIIAFLAYTAQVTLHYFETRPQIIVFLKNGAKPEDISSLQNKLNSNVKLAGSVKYVSHEDAFKIFQKVVDNPLVTELLPPDVFQASLEFSVSDLSYVETVIAELKKEPIVDQVQFTGSLGENSITEVIHNLQNITRYVRIGGVTLLSYLTVTAIFILVVIIGMRTASRRDEIEILKLIGATNTFIRLPFLLEAVTYGIVGALVGFLASFLLLLYAMPLISRYFGEIPIIPTTFNTLALYLGILLSGEFALAIVIGIIGSFIALTRYLRL